jgi:citrate lyase beta subunit
LRPHRKEIAMPVLTQDATRDVLAYLAAANHEFAQAYPGARPDRQPVHTVYGGAHLFSAGVAHKLGATALRMLDEYAPDFAIFARALGMPGAETLPREPQQVAELARALAQSGPPPTSERRQHWLACTVYRRVREKLQREPIEDFRLDFEDGYGNRTDEEEDGHAVAAAEQVAAGMREGSLPPFLGVRVKPLNEELRARSLRTLDLFLTTLVARSGGALPSNFVVTLPKVTIPAQVAAMVELFGVIEVETELAPGSLEIELMIETPQSIIDRRGQFALPALVAAARDRCRSAHFGTYDYTAGIDITAAWQIHTHPACDFARHAMQVCLAGSGVWLSDGATTLMPVPPHRATKGGTPLTEQQLAENRRAVHRAWKVHYDDVRSSLEKAYYQGWDLNPGQLPTRYAAVYSFFLEGREEAAVRLRTFIDRAAQATLAGGVFDDAATGQGLLNYFLRGINCGALTEQEALAAGLSLEELRGRSFLKILDARGRAERHSTTREGGSP